MRINRMAIAMAVVCMAALANVARADTTTLKLTGTGGGAEPLSNGESANVYPYYFTVGSTNNVALMCISFDNEVTQGESWTATIDPLSSSSSTFDKEEAYLFSEMLSTNNVATQAEIQFADWYLSDKNGVEATRYYNENSSAILGYVDDAKDNYAAEPASFYTQFQLYIPVNGTEHPDTYGTPQTFIGVAPTPEPGSLALLGSGLLGIGGIVRRKLRKA